MYIEPGLAESLNACMDPPGIPSKEQMRYTVHPSITLSFSYSFRKLSPYINFSYTPVYSLPLPRENGGDVGCYARVATTIQSILDNTSGRQSFSPFIHYWLDTFFRNGLPFRRHFLLAPPPLSFSSPFLSPSMGIPLSRWRNPRKK